MSGHLRTIRLAIGVFLVLVANNAAAKDPGQTSANLLKMGMGARGIAMAGAYTAIADEVTAIYWNPAGLVKVSPAQVCLMKNNWVEDVNQDFLAFARSIEGTRNNSVFASSVNYLDPGEIKKTTYSDKTGSSGRFYSAKDLVVTLAYACRLNPKTSLGCGLKLIQQMIDNEKAKGLAVDLGLLYQYSKDLRLGACLQNLGEEMEFIKDSYPLPLSLKLGLGYVYRNYLFSVETEIPTDHGPAVMVGLEGWLTRQFGLRCGYRYQGNNKLEKIHQLPAGLSMGLGFNLANFKLDYGYQPYGDLGDTHRISLTLGFKKGPEVEDEAKAEEVALPVPVPGKEEKAPEKAWEQIEKPVKEAVEEKEVLVVTKDEEIKKEEVKEPEKKEEIKEPAPEREKPEKAEKVEAQPEPERLPSLPSLLKKEEKELKKEEIKEPHRLLRTMQEANIYAGTGAVHHILTTIGEGTNLILLDDSNRWYYKVKLPDGQVGWISYLYVE